jgi:hypothetical protein
MQYQSRSMLALLLVSLMVNHLICNDTSWNRVKGLWNTIPSWRSLPLLSSLPSWKNPYEQGIDEYVVTPWEHGQLQREIKQKEAEFAALKALKQQPHSSENDPIFILLGAAHLDQQEHIVNTYGPLPKEKISLLLEKDEVELIGKFLHSAPNTRYPLNRLFDTPKIRYSVAIPVEKSKHGMVTKKSFWRPATQFDENNENQLRYNDLKRVEIPERKARQKEMSIAYCIQQGWGY